MRADSLIGAQLASYRIETLIGEGGMSRVYLAQHVVLQKKVALKLLSRELAHDESFRERFLRESRLAAALDHPNVVEIYDAGEADGLLYIAMRHIAGSDLRVLIHEHGALPPDRALAILGQVGDALDTAHERGLVHRDVKPGNILLGRDDHAYLTDFGVAKSSADIRGLTRTGYFIGTLDYAAPEQIRGEPLDGRADVYAFGCLLYQCLSGQLPYAGDTDVQIMFAHLEEPPPRLSQNGFEKDLDDVIARSMAKRREERYPTCAQVVAAAGQALSSAAAVPGGKAPPRAPEPVSPRPTAIDRVRDYAPVPIEAPRASRRRPSRRMVIGAGVGAVPLVAAAALLAAAVLGDDPAVLPTVNGQVVDARTNEPVSGVIVSSGKGRRVTDRKGRFTLGATTEGGAVSFKGCAYKRRKVAASAQPMRVLLQPEPVSGTVTSDLSGRPLRARIAGKQQASAAADGRFTLYGSCPGDVVVVSAPGHRRLRARIDTRRRLSPVLAATGVSDDFSSAAALFPESRSTSSEKYRRAGVYHVVVRRPSWQAMQIANLAVPLQSPRVSVEARKIAGSSDSSFGIVCRWVDNDRYYVLEISSEGFFRMQRRNGGRFVTLRDWTSSTAIRRDNAANHLAATCSGRGTVALSLSANGRTLVRLREVDGLPPGRVGLVASSYGRPGTHVVFDNFALKRF